MRKASVVLLAAFLGVGFLLASIPAFAAGPSVLRVTFAWPDAIDPAIGNDYASSSSLVNLYDTLVFPNAKGRRRPVAGGLLERCPRTA